MSLEQGSEQQTQIFSVVSGLTETPSSLDKQSCLSQWCCETYTRL